jgi:small-conductance mechanosensitive channel
MIDLSVIWSVTLWAGRLSGFCPILLSIIILAGLPAMDGIAALFLDLLRKRLIQPRYASRRRFRPSGDPEIEKFAPVEKMLAQEAIHAVIAKSASDLIAVVRQAARWVFAIAAAPLLAETWSFDPYLFLPQWVPVVLARIAEAAIILLFGWYAWGIFETSLAVKLSREDRSAQSRVRNLQPLLRVVGKLLIGAIALMSALSSLGFDILPLLASAGVVGIAAGFGAQTLLRDLFTGVIYLIEDVFRVGDYIESGNAKGTVERIMFRTLALRHQNGPLHFVPYGSLGSIRNNSRGWIIDKFEIPLPVTVDSELIRKLIKKIGLEMVADPELAKIIDVPLKAKVYRIDPGVKIFRCKVQTPPGKQFEIRAEGLVKLNNCCEKSGRQ